MAPVQPRTAESFTYPQSYSFPPFFTLQPNLQTRLSQLRKWSRLIQRYCRHHHVFKLSLVAALDTPLFKNAELRKRLSVNDALQVVDWMTRDEGGRRAEWIDGGVEAKGGTTWVYWKRPEEWAEVIVGWVEDTGQKNTVLTLYELMNGEMTVGQGIVPREKRSKSNAHGMLDFHGMDAELFHRSLAVLVKRGKAQVFGSEDQQGVKFF
ncbi:hypothetical protein HO173_007499 [Letharia columbiana]|uniref:Vacuolar protein-sorting-associated protein 25 n=1 Tax=Letharia columbiana TaxID=112416 RepID=A0A8H6L3P3_9LECA|nr:uncharacterized protein HO173_011889 [Letharia columbiana]XP_037163705.1 uncharacterized protein HO173_007499 [Letharia columbiana]KAF6227787.1 hypothetical protein HO173_011889 [Letharia columbiana]KAF6234305.1 hypothetical protein HO173_007499 [Letharia columbiana]